MALEGAGLHETDFANAVLAKVVALEDDSELRFPVLKALTTAGPRTPGFLDSVLLEGRKIADTNERGAFRPVRGSSRPEDARVR